jgi:hypothetical protein
VKLLARNAQALRGFRHSESEVVKALANKKAEVHRVFHLHGSYLTLMVIDKIKALDHRISCKL